MYLVTLAWLYVVMLTALVEAFSTQGSVLGAVITFVMYGVLPLSLVLFVMGTPLRRRRRAALEHGSSAAPDGGSHAPGNPVAPERKEP